MVFRYQQILRPAVSHVLIFFKSQGIQIALIHQELYYGNIDPQARGYCPKSPVKKVSDSLNALEEKLTKQLAGGKKELFLRFCNAYAEFMGECELDTFITGFRLGARFMIDTFLSDDTPFEGLLEG